jgi:RNA polymerase sigma-70 factor (ECF subfamily)
MSVEAPDEHLLLSAAVDGDGAAFSTLFDRHYPMIHAFAYRLCLNATDAEEVAQETFIKVARSLSEYRGPSFRAWLYRIARNCMVDRHRRRERDTRLAHEWMAEFETDSAGREGNFEPVSVALSALPESLREAIVLTVYEEMTHAEAAKVLGCAEATVSWRVFQAKRKLRKLLGGTRP